jgi:hypothetical protein
VAVAWLVLLAILSGACSDAVSEGPRIALLLPETKTARYETQDRPAFEARLAEVCPDCEAMVHNAGHDAARQQAQAEAALTNGADGAGARPGRCGLRRRDRTPRRRVRRARSSPTTACCSTHP